MWTLNRKSFSKMNFECWLQWIFDLLRNQMLLAKKCHCFALRYSFFTQLVKLQFIWIVIKKGMKNIKFLEPPLTIFILQWFNYFMMKFLYCLFPIFRIISILPSLFQEHQRFFAFLSSKACKYLFQSNRKNKFPF